MYSYTWDIETGGLLLNSSPLAFSKEPRPVYYEELDILGFDQIWNYEKNDAYPYMWAESNNYFYRGRLVAKTKGGSLYTAPEIILVEDPEPDGQPLRFVDIPAMVEKNRYLIETLAQDTIKKIYNTYVDYKSKVDVFYVAFSGGKDSIVTLDLVQRTLPHNEFKVLFGDTGMEFPDTYDVVKDIESTCRNCDIDFIRAKSVYQPEYTWSKFGPPATVTRWCCSVHKTAPQILALRTFTGKPNFTGMAFIGIRASESLSRSEYDYISLGEKHKGQYSCNPILEWNSAELYTYIFTEKLPINNSYKKGHRRAGCLVCPRAAERNDWMSQAWYPKEVDSLVSVIKNMYSKGFQTEKLLDEFISNGGWKARKNGRDIAINLDYLETILFGRPTIKVSHPHTEWKEWIKTVGVVLNDFSPYTILFQNEQLTFEVKETKDGLEVSYDAELPKTHPLFVKLLKNVFRKTACCILCRECEADCHNGCISMKKGKVSISDKCVHCFQCHKVEKGCLVYKSLEMPKGGLKMSTTQSLNCYSHHAPKMEWFEQFFSYKNEFDQRHSLGSQMYSFFKRFLRDADLLNENGFSDTAGVIDKLGLDNLSSWSVMLVNLAYTPQINWLIKRVPMNESYSKDYTLSLLVSDGAKESWVNDIWSSFIRIVELPFGVVGLGCMTKEKSKAVAITRTPWQNPDPLVILYSLYKFAEACGDYYQFTLNRLLAHDIDSDGVSPTEIFGLERGQMEKLLNGLSVNYPDFITTSFTLDLDNITLNADKTSQDVLSLM
ncbi:phosphoadenosine phosphosulfate reductase family protein [Acetanaerobacterium elongatum]|uniref:Phosphoadenosine phosphosulfate reductase n=1 Tax=Acetanaerobacterium elongatum TaxID=258515 RepID=A0A1G9YCW8_9FIRM|nr:phosphoadenosine phosphosulfate reductase family protein [Acetanaerobacterium elongatum]SDN06476.1 phosphoadenosine phosphosulfate reductase [Acetanaerobacterium elongatum]